MCIRDSPILPLLVYNLPGENRFNTKFGKLVLANTATPSELKHWLRLFKGYFEDGRGHLCTLSTQYRAVMESVDPTISTFLQPSFDAQLPVMKMATDLTAPCIMDQIILYFQSSLNIQTGRSSALALALAS